MLSHALSELAGWFSQESSDKFDELIRGFVFLGLLKDRIKVKLLCEGKLTVRTNKKPKH